jgi:hypothetical protein
VEFAVILPVLFSLLFGVFEFGRIMQAHITLQHAVDEAARYAITGEGYSDGSGVRETKIEGIARKALTGLMINTSASSNQSNYLDISIRSSQSSGNPNEADSAGGANEFVRVSIRYNQPIMAWLFSTDKAYIGLDASALVVNEHFARPLLPVGELPALPPATWTPTPTPTPIGTPTNTPTPNATATIQAQGQATSTAQAQATATVQAQATGTAQSQATATSTSTPSAATATAQAKATATAKAQATATAKAQATATAQAEATPTATSCGWRGCR